MSLRCQSVSLKEIWLSNVVAFLDRILLENWGSVGITSEVEARLGRVTEQEFDAGVSMKFFYSMRDYLMTRPCWTDESGNSITPQEREEYAVLFEQGIRVILAHENNDYKVKEVICKRNVEKETFVFGDQYYALRLSLSDEIPLSQQDLSLYSASALAYIKGQPFDSSAKVMMIRRRYRTSFNYKNQYTIDMTSTESGKTLASLSPTVVYEVECELGFPQTSQPLTVSLFLEAILHRLFSQPPSIAQPPPMSKFNPSNCEQLEKATACLVPVRGAIELISSQGYDDSLLQWCKRQDPQGRALLPVEAASQLQWSLAHPARLFSLNGMPFDTEAEAQKKYSVINNGGTIRTHDGQVFHCCIWQYEGIMTPTDLPLPSSFKRSDPTSI